MRASPIGSRSHQPRSTRQGRALARPTPHHGALLGLAQLLAGVLLMALVVAPVAHGQTPPAGDPGYAWAFVTAFVDPDRAPPEGIAEKEVTVAADTLAGRVALAFDASGCTETRIGSWTAPLAEPLVRGDTIVVPLLFTIDAPGCRDGRTTGVAIDVAARPAFLTDATGGAKPFAGYRFVDAFAASMPNAAATDSGSGRPLLADATVTVFVTADPSASDELAEFRVTTGVPGYAVVVAYVFRAVARP